MTKLSPKAQALIELARKNNAIRMEELARKAASNPLDRSKFMPYNPAGPEPSSNPVQRLEVRTPESVQPSVRIGPDKTTVSAVLTQSGTYHPTVPGIELNSQQQSAVELSMRGESICLIGAAGTGKTTTTREVIGQLVRLPHITPIGEPTRYLEKGSPGVVIVSFTNKAVNNIKKFLPEELKRHCMTIHKLLEYKPVTYEIAGGDGKKTMRFEPSFDRTNPLPHISCIIVEESSMVSEELFNLRLLAALPAAQETQFIFLGDLNQLPPIFGPSILGFKLNELKTVELTHVYRQALQSPIIELAHKVREGRGFYLKGNHLIGTDTIVDDRGEHGRVAIRPWKQKVIKEHASRMTLEKVLIPMVTKDDYDFNDNAILCPFNKSFGTIALNRGIADALTKKRGAIVYEVIARYTRSYWAVGDRVLYDRQEALITKIVPTPGYDGPIPCLPSKTLTRDGVDNEAEETGPSDDESGMDSKEAALDALESLDGGEDENSKNLASHTITIEYVDSGIQVELSSSGAVNSLALAYVLTVHKSQGSEWRRVFLLLHFSHNSMLSRELLYTAITRAKHELFIICEPDRDGRYNSITRAAKSPEIHGVTLAEKAAYFRQKAKEMKRIGRQKEIEEGMEDA